MPMPNPIQNLEEDLAVLKRARNKRLLMLSLSLVGLFAFIFWEGLLLKSFIRQDQLPPSWDQADHMDIAWDYWQALRGGKWDFKTVFTLPPKSGMPPFPPLYHLSLIAAYSSAHPATAAFWVNYAYFIVLCLSVFACSYFFRPDYTATLAAASFCASPVIWQMTTTQLMDMPTAAIAAAALWGFLISDGFSQWAGSLLFGFLFAAGMMMKWSFFSYFIPILVVAAGNLKFPHKRWKIIASAAFSSLLFLPWYLYHLPTLIPRLSQASSDMAVPLWNGGVISYLFSMLDGLGPFVWAVGLAGILTAQYKRHRDWGWVILATVVSSYVFWTLVPNKQLRFLLPGLPGLAIAAASAWPNVVLWFVAGFQILTVANLNTHWISAFDIPTPLHAIPLFPANPPLDQNWPIQSILETAEKLSDPALPLNTMTLVANDVYFNGPNFGWMRDYLGLKKVFPIPPHKRLCEFSEFLLLKTDSLGPSGVIGGLKEARDTALDPDGWFLSAYQQAAQWRLPDQSLAILFQQKRFKTAPFKEKKIYFQFYSMKNVEAENLTLNLGAWDPKSASYPEAELSASVIYLRGLAVSNLRLKMKNLSLVPVFNQQKKWDGDIRFLKMKELDLFSANVSSSDLVAFAAKRAPGLIIRNLSIDKDLRLDAQWEKIPLKLKLSAQILPNPDKDGSSLRLSVESLHLGPVPIPHFLLSWWAHQDIPFYPNSDTPFKIVPAGLTLANGSVDIP